MLHPVRIPSSANGITGLSLMYLVTILARVMCFPNTLEPDLQKKQVPNIIFYSFYLVLLGLHRYVYLVFKQKGKISDPEHGKLTNRSDKNRGQWKASKFVEKHGLGTPIAGNLYQVCVFQISIS